MPRSSVLRATPTAPSIAGRRSKRPNWKDYRSARTPFEGHISLFRRLRRAATVRKYAPRMRLAAQPPPLGPNSSEARSRPTPRAGRTGTPCLDSPHAVKRRPEGNEQNLRNPHNSLIDRCLRGHSVRRRRSGEPLYRLEDIRALVRQSGLKLHVSPEALRWLQGRASTLGMGGIGKAMVNLYLAAKVAFAKGDGAITVAHLEDAEELTMGSEDAEAVAEAVAEASGMRRVV